MLKKCVQCGDNFEAARKDKVFCHRKCIYKAYNDLRPRKTHKSYIKANELKNKHFELEKLAEMMGSLLTP